MKSEEFKKKNDRQKRTSCMDKFKTDILDLHNDNYSLVSIQEYLALNGVITSFQNISKYLRKIKEEKTETVKIFSKGSERNFKWIIRKSKK